MGVPRILTVNAGSSSLKFAVFDPDDPPRRLLAGAIERIGLPGTILRAGGPEGLSTVTPVDPSRPGSGLLDWLDGRGELGRMTAVGHRVVHGGPDHADPQLVTPELIRDLTRISPLDPAHLPAELALMEAFAERCPGIAQVACFDTAFHQTLPRVARLLPIPRHYEEAGVRRCGFHGLSYAFLMEELGRVAGPEAALGRVVLAHLGGGSSMASVGGGRCVETTMGFTPTGGLVMGTRTGDLDPGLLIHLLRTEGLSVDVLDDLVNRRSGLLGVSETSPDMRDLLARRATDARAADAVELYCYQARKWVGTLAAALGGIDTLVFSGGVGENAPEVRTGICEGLGFLGIHLEPAANAANADVISPPEGPCAVRVIKTDEELIMARTVVRLLGLHPDPAPQEDAR